MSSIQKVNSQDKKFRSFVEVNGKKKVKHCESVSEAKKWVVQQQKIMR